MIAALSALPLMSDWSGSARVSERSVPRPDARVLAGGFDRSFSQRFAPGHTRLRRAGFSWVLAGGWSHGSIILFILFILAGRLLLESLENAGDVTECLCDGRNGPIGLNPRRAGIISAEGEREVVLEAVQEEA